MSLICAVMNRMQLPHAEALYPLIENDTYHVDGKPHIFCSLPLGKLMSSFHHEMIYNRTSCVHDIVEFMVDHWIRIKLLFFFNPDACLASHSKTNHDHCLLQWPE